jgi:glycosyltransferase involved in cell wall biosynthesis
VKTVYGTNIWSHYQVAVAWELAQILGPDHFRMALFEQVHAERRALGWGEKNEYPWVIGPPKSEAERADLYQQCLDADVMIYGACPGEVLEARVAAGKLTLVASERLLKKPFHRIRLLSPRYALRFRQYRALVNHPHVHALAIGYYAADDLLTLGLFGDRIWKWAYFAQINPEAPKQLPDRPLRLLWAGRMLHWKRVDTLLRAVARVYRLSGFGECVIVGDGPEKERLQRLARRLRLNPDQMRFLPPVPFAEVRCMMRDSDVYVLSSNRREGWGVVANEAMSEGCVLVGNGQAGASKELVVDGQTGLLFRDGDAEHLATLLEGLSSDHNMRMYLRQQAWERMQTVWHPRVAAERLVALCEGIRSGKPPKFTEGPCSRPLRIKNRLSGLRTYE